MNHIRTFLGLFSVVLTMMLIPLSVEAQNVKVPAGTDQSVKYLGQIYVETGDAVMASGNVDKLPDFAAKVTEKYAAYIDVNVRLNDSDRRYLSKCLMYNLDKALRVSFRHEGINPDAPEYKPYLDQVLEQMSGHATTKLRRANTVGEALTVMETVFDDL